MACGKLSFKCHVNRFIYKKKNFFYQKRLLSLTQDQNPKVMGCFKALSEVQCGSVIGCHPCNKCSCEILSLLFIFFFLQSHSLDISKLLIQIRSKKEGRELWRVHFHGLAAASKPHTTKCNHFSLCDNLMDESGLGVQCGVVLWPLISVTEKFSALAYQSNLHNFMVPAF